MRDSARTFAVKRRRGALFPEVDFRITDVTNLNAGIGTYIIAGG